MSKTGKRPIRALTAHEKLEAIKRVHDGESKASVARDIGVPESTLRGWCKNETKISYQSRQSSPDTDESYEPKEKRVKAEQPFNLSLKTTGTSAQAASLQQHANMLYTPPNSESLYTPLDFSKNDMDATPKTPQNLSIKNEIPKSTASQMTEREKTRAELARLSVELGLNRPEMFGTTNTTSTTSPSNSKNNSNSTLADLAANITLLSQWNSLMMQQQLMQNSSSTSKKLPNPTSSLQTDGLLNNNNGSSKNNGHGSSAKLPKEQQSVDEYIKCWLRTQEAILSNQSRSNGAAGLPSPSQGAATTSVPSTTTAGNGTSVAAAAAAAAASNSASAYQTSWFWKWYKQLTYNQQQQQQSSSTAAIAAAAAAASSTLPPPQSNKSMPEKPILYQQLTKEGEISSSGETKQLTTTSSPISNNNNNNNNVNNNSTSKARSVLDNLLCINNNQVSVKVEDEQNGSSGGGLGGGDLLSAEEALEHGEKFMKWLETCSDPSVTAMQIMQFKSLLNNIRNGAERKNNGDLHNNKTKVKRK